MASGDSFAPPHGFEWFADQIAGHLPSVVKRQIGIVKRLGSTVIHKPSQKGSRGEREINAYHLILRNEGSQYDEKKREDTKTLRDFVPRFHGVEKMIVDGKEHEFLVLDDITINYRLPVILDVKMGLVTFDPLASGEKRLTESTKYPPQSTLGFRISGYRMHTPDGVRTRDKEWGKTFDETTVHLALREYLSARPLLEVVSRFINRLEEIASWFDTQRLLHFYSSSLLLIYEADPSLPPSIDIRLIDFSHTYPAQGKPDSNYIPGLRKLLDIFQSLQYVNNI
ncbi:hypothetical protein PENTCL1PPCAC_18254 [Pristionchus entomophagus]|uniref:Kinase n=1 Tax=Pristionchus entomophagus TaxID=358040 RepID=A0AAV5TP57_9BILA|nr:hypothetical protein PENTCL1PPCAC_18254 [Pristionchus entomophagus]